MNSSSSSNNTSNDGGGGGVEVEMGNDDSCLGPAGFFDPDVSTLEEPNLLPEDETSAAATVDPNAHSNYIPFATAVKVAADSSSAMPANVVVTLVDSNDPSSVRAYQEAPTVPSAAVVDVTKTPKIGVGLITGWLRDNHFFHIVLLLLGMFYTYFSLNSRVYRDGSREIPFWPMAIWYIIYLFEGLVMSGDGQALQNMDTSKAVIAYLDQLYRAEPLLSLQIECYHYYTQYVPYCDGEGKMRTRAETHKIVTFIGREDVQILACRDATQNRVTEVDLQEYQLTKIELTKNFSADARFSQQVECFRLRHQYLDDHYNMRINFEIPKFQSNLMSYVQEDNIPWFVDARVYRMSHFLVLPALPYRLWLSSRSGKCKVQIQKQILTAGTPH